MAFTKGELLRHAIAFALRSVRLSGTIECTSLTIPCASCADTVNGENWMT